MNIRRLVLFVVGAVLVMSVPLAAMAQSAEDLTTLARYFPVESPVFIGVRADDDYLDSLDTLIDRVARVTDEQTPLPAGIRESLTYLIGELVPGGTFDNTIRAWMGDTFALGINDLSVFVDDVQENDRDGFVVALDVQDADALRAFIEEVLIPNSDNVTNVETLEVAGASVYEVLNDQGVLTYYAVFDDAAFISGSLIALETVVISGSGLNTAAEFTGAFAELPADQYNVVGFVNSPMLIEASLASIAASEVQGELNLPGGGFGAAQAALQQAGVVAFGATVLDGRTLTIDVAQLAGDTVPRASASVDPTFARYIPAGTPLVIHGHDLAGGLNAALTAIRTTLAEANLEDVDAESLDDGLSMLNFFTRGTMELDIQEDILSWMTGDFALTLALADNFPSSTEALMTSDEMPIEFGLLFEATNPDLATALVAGLRRFAEMSAQDDSSVRVESVVEGGVEALRVTIDTPDAPFDVVLMAGTSGDVFVFGTQRMVTAALAPVNGLDSDPLYQEAAAYLLPNPAQVWYFAGEPLMPLVELAHETETVVFDSDPERLLTLFHSSSISSLINENGTTLTRIAMTLPE